MCKIMHVSPDVMDKTIKGQDLILLGQHADKYNTVRALGPATYYWVNEALANKKISGSNREILFGTAFTFEHGGLFERIGREIVMQDVGGKQLAEKDCTETLSGLLRECSNISA